MEDHHIGMQTSDIKKTLAVWEDTYRATPGDKRRFKLPRAKPVDNRQLDYLKPPVPDLPPAPQGRPREIIRDGLSDEDRDRVERLRVNGWACLIKNPADVSLLNDVMRQARPGSRWGRPVGRPEFIKRGSEVTSKDDHIDLAITGENQDSTVTESKTEPSSVEPVKINSRLSKEKTDQPATINQAGNATLDDLLSQRIRARTFYKVVLASICDEALAKESFGDGLPLSLFPPGTAEILRAASEQTRTCKLLNSEYSVMTRGDFKCCGCKLCENQRRKNDGRHINQSMKASIYLDDFRTGEELSRVLTLDRVVPEIHRTLLANRDEQFSWKSVLATIVATDDLLADWELVRALQADFNAMLNELSGSIATISCLDIGDEGAFHVHGVVYSPFLRSVEMSNWLRDWCRERGCEEAHVTGIEYADDLKHAIEYCTTPGVVKSRTRDAMTLYVIYRLLTAGRRRVLRSGLLTPKSWNGPPPWKRRLSEWQRDELY